MELPPLVGMGMIVIVVMVMAVMQGELAALEHHIPHIINILSKVVSLGRTGALLGP